MGKTHRSNRSHRSKKRSGKRQANPKQTNVTYSRRSSQDDDSRSKSSSFIPKQDQSPNFRRQSNNTVFGSLEPYFKQMRDKSTLPLQRSRIQLGPQTERVIHKADGLSAGQQTKAGGTARQSQASQSKHMGSPRDSSEDTDEAADEVHDINASHASPMKVQSQPEVVEESDPDDQSSYEPSSQETSFISQSYDSTIEIVSDDDKDGTGLLKQDVNTILKKLENSDQLIKKILKKKPEKRSDKDIHVLEESLSNNHFFQRYKDDPEMVKQLLTYSSYENLLKGQHVMDYGEFGTKFYIILKGTVNIHIPNKVKLSMNLLEYIQFLHTHGSLIQSVNGDPKFSIPKLPTQLSPSIKQKLTQNSANTSEIGTRGSFALQKSMTVVGAEGFNSRRMTSVKLARSDSIIEEVKEYNIHYLKKEVQLKEGTSFGELALLNSKPRAATIIVDSQSADFAVLDKQHFRMTMQKVHEEKIEQRIAQLDIFLFFRRLSKTFKQKLLYYVKPKIFSQTVIDECQPAGNLYFIVKGEVEIYKSISCESEQYIEGLKGDDQIRIDYSPLQASEQVKTDQAPFFGRYGKLLSSGPQEVGKVNYNDYLKKKVNCNKKRVGLLKLSEGEIIGAEELMMEARTAFTGARCVGKRLEVLELSYDDFKQKIKNDQCTAQLKELAESRLEFINNRLIKLEKIEARLLKKKKQERIMQTLEDQNGSSQLQTIMKDMEDRFEQGFKNKMKAMKLNLAKKGFRKRVTSEEPWVDQPKTTLYKQILILERSKVQRPVPPVLKINTHRMFVSKKKVENHVKGDQSYEGNKYRSLRDKKKRKRMKSAGGSMHISRSSLKTPSRSEVSPKRYTSAKVEIQRRSQSIFTPQHYRTHDNKSFQNDLMQDTSGLIQVQVKPKKPQLTQRHFKQNQSKLSGGDTMMKIHERSPKCDSNRSIHQQPPLSSKYDEAVVMTGESSQYQTQHQEPEEDKGPPQLEISISAPDYANHPSPVVKPQNMSGAQEIYATAQEHPFVQENDLIIRALSKQDRPMTQQQIITDDQSLDVQFNPSTFQPRPMSKQVVQCLSNQINMKEKGMPVNVQFRPSTSNMVHQQQQFLHELDLKSESKIKQAARPISGMRDIRGKPTGHRYPRLQHPSSLLIEQQIHKLQANKIRRTRSLKGSRGKGGGFFVSKQMKQQIQQQRNQVVTQCGHTVAQNISPSKAKPRMAKTMKMSQLGASGKKSTKIKNLRLVKKQGRNGRMTKLKSAKSRGAQLFKNRRGSIPSHNIPSIQPDLLPKQFTFAQNTPVVSDGVSYKTLQASNSQPIFGTEKQMKAKILVKDSLPQSRYSAKQRQFMSSRGSTRGTSTKGKPLKMGTNINLMNYELRNRSPKDSAAGDSNFVYEQRGDRSSDQQSMLRTYALETEEREENSSVEQVSQTLNGPVYRPKTSNPQANRGKHQFETEQDGIFGMLDDGSRPMTAAETGNIQNLKYAGNLSSNQSSMFISGVEGQKKCPEKYQPVMWQLTNFPLNSTESKIKNILTPNHQPVVNFQGSKQQYIGMEKQKQQYSNQMTHYYINK